MHSISTTGTSTDTGTEQAVIDTRICYLTGRYISHQRAAEGNRAALERAGARFVVEPRQADVVIVHDDLRAISSYFARFPSMRKRYVVGAIVWEIEHLSDERRAALSLLDEVWTPSTFSQRILAAAHDNVVRMPHLVKRLSASAEAIRGMRRRVGFNPNCFYLYTITRPGDPRKNTPALMRAFARVHRAHPEVRLLLKQYGHAVKVEAEGVTSIPELLTQEGIAALHAVGDAFVSPHRAEGWGLALADALASGNPVIATDYSGSRDFLGELEGYPVPFELTGASDDDRERMPDYWSPQTRWAEIDPDQLVAAMESAWTNRRDDPRRWRATAIIARYGMESLAKRMRLALGRIAAEGRRKTRSPVARTRPVVGLFHRPDSDREVILGRVHAVDGLMAGYAQHGRELDYAVFTPEGSLEATQRELRVRGSWMTLHSRRALEERLEEAPVDLWCDAQLDTTTPFAVRRQVDGRFPITVLHHTISYRHLIGSRWLPYLLARPRAYDSLICTSTAARKAMRKLLDHTASGFAHAHGVDLQYRGRLDHIPLGVDTSRFAPGDPRPGRARFDIDHDAFVLLWVGRLSAIDKADLLPLVQALAELRRRVAQPLVLVCCGTERKGDTLGTAIADYAQVLGVGEAVQVLTDVREGLDDLYRAADVFVSPVDNLQESFGLAALEAMSSGLPQVCADWDGYRDTVVDGETGLLVPTFWADVDGDISPNVSTPTWHFDHLLLSQAVAVDLRKLVSAIERLITDSDLRQRLGRASRERAIERYDWRHVVAAHEALFIELIEQARREPEEPADVDYLRPRYTDTFAHYPTAMVTMDHALKLSAHGLRVARGEVEAPTHHDRVWRYLDRDLLRWLFARLGETESTTPERLKARHGAVSDAQLLRHLMWLLKYDVVKMG
jgi:glycosyltransferase involved in cell wall biosynthesis